MTHPKLMGILNITPDSFYDGGTYSQKESAIERGLLMISQGADLIDIGGESSRPGASTISEREEKQRVIPVIEALVKQTKTRISIDTTKAGVAQAAIKAGATFVNDITGCKDPRMSQIIAETGVDVCVMHMQGSPQTMQKNPYYPQGVLKHLMQFFEERTALLMQQGIDKSQIVIDPGIGFGKTIAHNLEILQNLQKIKDLGFPLLLGTSRKSFMGKLLNLPAQELLSTTLVVNALALLQGADVLRVHDLIEHRRVMDFLVRAEEYGYIPFPKEG